MQISKNKSIESHKKYQAYVCSPFNSFEKELPCHEGMTIFRESC